MGDKKSSFPGFNQKISFRSAKQDCGRDDELFTGEGVVLEEDLLQIAEAIRNIPDLSPPAGFSSSVMQAVRSRKMPLWYRLYHWAKAPRSFTFSFLQVVPTVALLVIVCAASIFYTMGRSGEQLAGGYAEGKLIPVQFTLNMPNARSVSLIGSFNDWHIEKCPMEKHAETWTVTVYLPSGRYEYAFLVDGGKIVPDPRSALYQEDGFGNRNAVLVLGNNDENTI
jgi:hypothetical protein